MTTSTPENYAVSPQAVLLGLASAFAISRAIQLAADLGIADRVGLAGSTIEELAGATATHPQSLYRLLRMLASHGIFVEDEAGRFHLNELSEPLRSDAPGSVRDTIRIVDQGIWSAWGELGHSLATGQPAFDAAFGTGFFAYHDTNPVANERFARGMAQLSSTEDPVVPQCYDFSPFDQIVDVGGGRGGLLAEILKAYPQAHGVLYDRAAVVAEPLPIIASGVADRCTIESGDFFQSLPPGGDVYIVKRILHDWPDDRCLDLLQLCARAVRPGGRVLVIEAVVPSGNVEHPSKDVDIMMLALLGGQERTVSQFEELFRRAGLRMLRTVPLPALVSIIEAEPLS